MYSMDKMTKWPTFRLSKYIVKWILLMIVLVASTISIYMNVGDVWYCILMLTMVKMADMVDESDGKI